LEDISEQACIVVAAHAIRTMGSEPEDTDFSIPVSFLAESPSLVSAVSMAIKNQDPKSLERATHSLKSNLAIFAAQACTDLAVRLETVGREGDLVPAEGLCGSLEKELAQLRTALADRFVTIPKTDS
jgi:HPt (histidine-containing phosphotransfer) domain-containing protein